MRYWYQWLVMEGRRRQTNATLFLISTRDLRKGFREAMCQNSSSQGTNSSGEKLSVTIPIYNYPVTFGGNYDQAKSDVVTSGACSDKSSKLNDTTYVNVIREVVSPEIVSAWVDCRTKQGGFFINGDLNGNDLVLEFRFRPLGNVTQTKLIGPPDITGANCPHPVVKDHTVINNARKFQKCLRIGTGPITVIANARFDGAKFFVPAVVPAPSCPRTTNRGAGM